MNIEKIGQNIDQIRKARKWSQVELAHRMDSTPCVIGGHIKTGRMNIDTLLKYAEVLGCSVADLTADVVDADAFSLTTDITSYYPYDLVLAVAGGEYDKFYNVYIPAVMESLNDLTERERKVLDLRYRQGKTLKQCGEVFGVQGERIRQIEARALRKLRHPRHFKKWHFDTTDKAWEIAKERDALRLHCVTLERKLYEAIGDKPKEEPKMSLPEVTVDEMELSVRSYNCLCRAGLRKLSDFDGLTTERLMRVRNLGRKSCEEILRKLEELGLEPDETGTIRSVANGM